MGAQSALDLRRLVLDEIDVVTCVAHVCADDLPAAVELLSSDTRFDDLVAPPVPLEHLPRALRALARGSGDPRKHLFAPLERT